MGCNVDNDVSDALAHVTHENVSVTALFNYEVLVNTHCTSFSQVCDVTSGTAMLVTDDESGFSKVYWSGSCKTSGTVNGRSWGRGGSLRCAGRG